MGYVVSLYMDFPDDHILLPRNESLLTVFDLACCPVLSLLYSWDRLSLVLYGCGGWGVDVGCCPWLTELLTARLRDIIIVDILRTLRYLRSRDHFPHRF